MPPVGPGSVSAPIVVRAFAALMTENTHVTNPVVSVAPTTKTLDTTKVGGALTLDRLSFPVLGVAQLDSLAGSATVTVGSAVHPAAIGGGSIVYFASDGSPLMTLRLTGGAVTGFSQTTERQAKSTITFNTTISL